MATTTTNTAAKKTAAKKSTAKKTAANKTAAKKTAAKKTTATKSAATKTTAAKSTATEAIVDDVNQLVGDTTERATEAFETAVRFARDAAFTSFGAGFVIQDRLSQRNFELMEYSAFLDAAKAKGEVQFEELQSMLEPIASRFTQVVEPIVERIEENLPKQVKDVVDANRDRVRELLSF